MTDVASIGVETHVTGGDNSVRQLDAFGKATERAENSAKGASSATGMYNKMLVDLLGSIDRTLTRLTAIAQVQSKLTPTAIRAAEAQLMLAKAAETEAKAMRDAEIATEKAASSIMSAGKSAKIAANDFASLYDLHSRDFVTTYVAGMNKVEQVHGKVDKSSKYLTQTTLNLSRQFADIGVTAAMGMSPLMILIQQGPQIADAFATAKTQGLGFKAVLAGIGTALAPFLAILAAIAAAVAVIASAFALGTREINKGAGDLTKKMGLTEEQIERVKNKTVTMGDTVKATFQVTGRYLYEAFKGPLDKLSKAFSDAMDWITKNSALAIGNIVGGFIGAFNGIKAVWKMLPAAIGDMVISAVNISLNAITTLINKAGSAVNVLIDKANEASKAAGGPQLFNRLGIADLGQMQNKFAGAGEDAGKAFSSAFGKGLAQGQSGVQKFFGDITKQAEKNAMARISKEAGKALKGPKGRAASAEPRDQSDERLAALQAALADAMADELRARMALAVEVDERAALEKQVLDEQLKMKQATIDKTLASIADDKGLTAAQKAQLTLQWKSVKIVNDITNTLQKRKVDEGLIDAKAKEALALQTAQTEAQISLLQHQSSIAKYAFQKRAIDQEVLKLQTQIEKQKLQEVINSALSTRAEKDIAAAKLATLDVILKGQIEDANSIDNSFSNVNDAMNSMADAFKRHDWNGALKSMFEAVGSFKASWSSGVPGSKIGAVAGVAGAVGGMIGGRAGKVLSGAASGAMAGAQFGPWGAAIGGVIGGLSGLLGKSEKAKRREAEAQEALKKAAEIAAQKLEMEGTLLALQGKATEALAKSREMELSKMDASLRSLQQQIYAEQDAAAIRSLNVDLLYAMNKNEEALAASRAEELRSIIDAHKPIQQAIWALNDLNDASKALADQMAKTKDIQVDILTASGDAIGALAVQRQKELEALDASLRPLQQASWELQDAQKNLIDARSALAEALQRDMTAVQGTIENLKKVGDAFEEFASRLKFDPANNNLNPVQATDRLRGEFNRLNALPPGDQERLAKLQGVSEQFLEASKASSVTGSAYNRDLQAVRRAVEASQKEVANQITEAQKQLDALTAIQQTTAGVGTSVDSVAAAVNNLAVAQAAYAGAQAAAAAALQAQLAAQGAAQQALATSIAAAQATASQALAQAQSGATGAASSLFNPSGYLSKNPDVMAEFARHTSNSDIAYLASLGIYNAEGYAQWHYDKFGKTEGRQFASGGAFQNGIVKRPTNFAMGQMGERGPEAIMPLTNIGGQLGVRASNDNGEMVAAIRELRDSMVDGFAAMVRMERTLDKLELLHDSWDKRGLYVRGEAPGEPVQTEAA